MAKILSAEYIIGCIRLIRPMQWYKNILIFLPLFFAGFLLEPLSFSLTIFGFIALSLMSSVNYIINDIADKKEDSRNPEKKTRPVASGIISEKSALILALLLFISSLSIGFILSVPFFLVLVIFFLSTLLYTIWLKDEPFIDVILIAFNFVLRAISGAFIINVFISGWLITGTFALALFLAIAKRYSEIKSLGKKAPKHREVFKYYTENILKTMLIISAVILNLSYFIYTIFSDHRWLILSVPLAIYPIIRFYNLIELRSEIPRHLELFYKDKRLVTGIIATGITIFLILYLEMII